MNIQLSDILTAYEAEHYIEGLQIFEITQLGCKKWFVQDEILQKLNFQAHINAIARSDEFIMEAFCTFDKIKPLIYDLIMTEMWKQYVFPYLKSHFTELSSIRSYTLFLKLFDLTMAFHQCFPKNPSSLVQFQILSVNLIIYHQLLNFQYIIVIFIQITYLELYFNMKLQYAIYCKYAYSTELQLKHQKVTVRFYNRCIFLRIFLKYLYILQSFTRIYGILN